MTNASERSDDECVRSALAGDRAAYSILVRRHQASLHRYLVRMVGSLIHAVEKIHGAAAGDAHANVAESPKVAHGH